MRLVLPLLLGVKRQCVNPAIRLLQAEFACLRSRDFLPSDEQARLGKKSNHKDKHALLSRFNASYPFVILGGLLYLPVLRGISAMHGL